MAVDDAAENGRETRVSGWARQDSTVVMDQGRSGVVWAFCGDGRDAGFGQRIGIHGSPAVLGADGGVVVMVEQSRWGLRYLAVRDG
ncbi:hypothetical protein M0R45_030831 [Rubus argutus]|uniref:Uncharacterized protein n=1 Tax=Rubus argutus TaxID=59490 RepID=A0AAW1WFS1_RUBAR